MITKLLVEGNVINTVVTNTTTPDSNETNNRTNNTTVAKPYCDLEIIKLVSSKKALVGELLTWTIKVTNHGPFDAENVKVLEDIPNSLKFIRYESSKGTFNKNTKIWTIGKLNNASSVTLTIITKVLEVGKITNPVEVSTSTHDIDKSNNKTKNSTEASTLCDLELTKSSDKKSYQKGDKMHWIIKVRNYGPCSAEDVSVEDALPDGVKFLSYEASKGSYSVSTSIWTIGTVAKGEEVILNIYCKILVDGCNITNHAVVKTSTNETNTENNYDNATIEVDSEPPVHYDPKTTSLRSTGNPIAYLLIALFLILGTFWSRNGKRE